MRQAVISEQRLLRAGFTAGLLAYGVTMVLYMVFDFLAARGPWFTVDMLGKAAIGGSLDPALLMLPQPLDGTAILWWNALQLGLSLMLGVLVAKLALAAPRRSALFLIRVGATVLALSGFTLQLWTIAPWWSMTVANSLAAACATAWLAQRAVSGRPAYASARRPDERVCAVSLASQRV